MADVKKIFNVVTDKQKVICPPDQVFVNSEFNFLLTIGGDLVEDEKEYNRFLATLKSIGETRFYIHENLGATITSRNVPFKTTVNLKDGYTEFQKKLRAFEPPIGWTTNHFFIYGQNENWGIYICECPTINIIGCGESLIDKFKKVFLINGNGFSDLKEFISREFQNNLEYFETFKREYRLEHK